MKEVTRERLEEIVSDPMINQGSEFAMMARMVLAAMDSEPVAYRWNYGGTTTWRLQDTKPGPGSNPRCPRVIEPLYRHAQPAPVVPEEKPMPNPLSMYAVDAVAAIAEAKGWNACRAAMLATAPQEVK